MRGSSVPVRLAVAISMIVTALQGTSVMAAPAAPRDWPFAGQNLQNTRNAPAEHTISPGNVGRLTQAWSVTTAGYVSATPTKAGALVYFPDSGGQLWAVDAASGEVAWSHSISDYTGVAADSSRTSPAVYGDELVLGDGYIFSPSRAGARLIAVDKTTGKKLWVTQVDSHPAAIITSSPVVYRGIVYVGVSSKEEVFAAQPGYQCCTFRGKVIAVDAETGRILWQTYTVPDNGGTSGEYSGGPVWGSTPAINPAANLLYIATGNNYTVPDGVCATPNATGCAAPASSDHVDSVLALDLGTGAIRWATSTLSGDAFTGACFASSALNCGPDFDFGSGPNLYTIASGRQLLGVGQKSGIYWALDPTTGLVVWATQVGPGGVAGGIQWGSATDGRRVYAAIANTSGKSYTITSAGGQQSTISGGSWAALDAATGKILWQTADPQGAMDSGFVSTANGVVYAGSTAVTGNNMYALDAGSGAILWKFASGGPVMSGAAVVHGTVYWGSGYATGSACPGAPTTTKQCTPPTGKSGTVYAFSLP